MRNEVIYDKKGIPSIMVVFTPEELGGGPACKVAGKTVKEICISKYQNTIIEGLPYSLPLQKPTVDITFDEAVAACEAKGEGWHLMTNAEWAALARMSKKNGTLPRGNTDSGKSHSNPAEQGITYDGGYGKALTGSGPATWSHDHTQEGVFDLCGNVWEWVGGVRWLNGMLQIIPDNNAAVGADQSKKSDAWVPVLTEDGDPIYYDVNSEDGITLTNEEPCSTDWEGVPFGNLDSEIEVPELLKELALYPEDDYRGKEYFYLDNEGERFAYRGGNWSNGSYYGVFAFSGNGSRSNSNSNVGFRAAFIRYSEIGQSGHLDNETETTEKSKKIEKFNKIIPPKHGLMDALKDITTTHMAEAYSFAGGEDIEGFKKLIHDAPIGEVAQAAQILPTLMQTALATKALHAGQAALLNDKEVEA